MKISFVVAMILAFHVSPARAYVENAVHGYASCISCHYAPGGGHLLTDYGRSLSSELMSTWSFWKNSENPVFGLAKTNDRLKTGGNFRSIQTYRENKSARSGKQFLMETNVELGVPYKDVIFVGSVGVIQGPRQTPDRGTFISDRHYLLWNTSEAGRLRLGKFRQRFGINDPNHTRLTKALLGFGPRSENYILEYTQYFENSEVSVSSSSGRMDQPRLQSSENNVSSTLSYTPAGNSILGASVLLGESDQQRRFLSGLHLVQPLTEHLSLLSELDFERSHRSTTPARHTDTLASQTRLSYKMVKGLLGYLVFEHSSRAAPSGYGLTTSPGLGFQWLPIPHVEIQTEYQIRTESTSNGDPNHIAWVLLHLYPF